LQKKEFFCQEQLYCRRKRYPAVAGQGGLSQFRTLRAGGGIGEIGGPPVDDEVVGIRRGAILKNMKLRNKANLKMEGSPDFTDINGVLGGKKTKPKKPNKATLNPV